MCHDMMARCAVRSAPLLVSLLLLGVAAACAVQNQQTTVRTSDAAGCAPDNGGITLPAGFCASVFADLDTRARHLTVAPNGDVFVALLGEQGVAGLRDTTGDGRADVTTRFGVVGGTGIAVWDGALYFGANDAVLRYPLPPGRLEPTGPPDTIVSGLPSASPHAAKPIVIADDGTLYVNIGSPSNACQARDRTTGSPGQDPCPELERRAGIWTFDARRTGQTQADGRRFVTGLRNAVALTEHPGRGTLFAVQHGRDQLHQNWPELYNERESAEKPSEELVSLEEGDDFGWPYCYHDPETDQKVLAPEYGGDKTTVGRCAEAKDPLLAFPGHWAPNAIGFYDGEAFPARYRGGAFVAFHGSWNRAPLPQAGYLVAFVPFTGEMPAGDYEIFANGFAGGNLDPRQARHRPTGVAVGPDGALYISDSRVGRIWRVVYMGQ